MWALLTSNNDDNLITSLISLSCHGHKNFVSKMTCLMMILYCNSTLLVLERWGSGKTYFHESWIIKCLQGEGICFFSPSFDAHYCINISWGSSLQPAHRSCKLTLLLVVGKLWWLCLSEYACVVGAERVHIFKNICGFSSDFPCIIYLFLFHLLSPYCFLRW